MEPDDLLCSGNARPQKALVGRAQWKNQSAPIPREMTSTLGGSILSVATTAACTQLKFFL
jgi:hypothetical protein